MTDRDVGRAEPTTQGAPPRFEHPIRATFDDLAYLVDGKAADYADDGNVFSNFEGAARLTGLTVEQVFHVMISIKQERLRQLMSGKTPNFEGIEDTLMDLANYTALWLTYRRLAGIM
jgi:hypothetical protein